MMKIDGGCHCGFIAYEGEADPEKAGMCHCTDCQKLSGTAFRTSIPVAREAFKLLSGTPTIYVKTAESGARRAQAFCPKCGSPIYAAEAVPVGETPEVYNIRVGTVRQRQQLAPKRQIWTKSRLHWLPEFASIPDADKRPSLD